MRFRRKKTTSPQVHLQEIQLAADFANQKNDLQQGESGKSWTMLELLSSGKISMFTYQI